MADEEMSIAGSGGWDEAMEMALFYAAIKFKPIGMHKHFRMINLQKHFNKHSHTQCTIAELWEKLGTMYNLQTLDEREDSGMFVDEDEEEEESEEERDISFKNSEEFVLPLHEFDHLVTEVESSRNPSPSPMRTTRAHREGSQTPSVADSSRASSPDEDDLPRKRRTSRSTKKSDVNETPSPRTTSTSTTTTTPSSTRRTRAKVEPAPATRGRKTGNKKRQKSAVGDTRQSTQKIEEHTKRVRVCETESKEQYRLKVIQQPLGSLLLMEACITIAAGGSDLVAFVYQAHRNSGEVVLLTMWVVLST
ncbi:hypothetical protein EDD11_003303 [Mortierella claussenii]|nr:hypothetical protein EDD11_003303 [Mortierella claussenii]